MKEKLNFIAVVIGIVTGLCTMVDFYITHFYRTAGKSQSETVSQQIPVKDTTRRTKSSEVQNNAVPASHLEKSSFFITFLKTPVVYFVLIIVPFAYFIVGLFQFFINLFTKFDTGFSLTIRVWDWGWHEVVVNWYWNHAISWHFWLSICIWAFILSLFNKE